MAISTPDFAAEPRASLLERLERNRLARRFRRNRVAVGAAVFILVLVVVAVFGPLLAPQDANAQHLAQRLANPSQAHLLGTDRFGRDTLSRLIVAARVTLVAGLQGLGIAFFLGVPLGLLAGYAGGLIDGLLSRVTDGLLALPPLILALALVGVLGTGLTNAMIAIGIVISPRFFRVARGAAKSIAEEAYIEAARADGAPGWRILVRHILPNASGPLLVQASLGAGAVITAEASLSFLGLGVQPPQASWGTMIREGFVTLTANPFTILPATVAVVATILAFFQLGDGLRDALGRGGGRDR
jgi:peptide/nickel transport system permease protein